MRIAAIFTFVCLLTTACAGIFGPDEWPVDLRITGAISPEQGKSDEYLGPPEPYAVGGAGQITVTSDILLGCVNNGIDASAKLDGMNLVLRVEEAVDERICVASTAKYTFEAVIPKLEPGTYHFRFYQQVFQTNEPRSAVLVLEQDIRAQ